MSFTVTSAPALFKEIIDTIFKDMEGCIWYLNYILIYSCKIETEYQAVVEKVLQQWVEHGLAVSQLKSKLHIHETIFLVHVINAWEVKLNVSKHKTLYKWPIFSKKNEVPMFLNLANYYCRFIIHNNVMAYPFID